LAGDCEIAAESKSMSEAKTKVLLIEDNASDACLIQEALSETSEGIFDIETAETLAAGVERLNAGGIDALLLDLALPDSFGQETFARARAHALGVAIIVLTGLQDATLAVKLVRGGAQDFVAKVDISGNNLGRAIRYAIEREKLDWEFRKLNDELEERIKERTTELESANRDLEEFSASVSHDLRAPLTNIHAYCNLLLENHASTLDKKGHRYLHHIKDGAMRMSALISDLLTLARVSRQGLHMGEADLNMVIDEVRREFDDETRDRGIEWRIGALPRIQCDEGLMRQVFVNLLANAVKYTRRSERPMIDVSHVPVDGKHAFMIKDNGIGFDMKYAERLFSPFQRLHSDKDFEGTGIGLATVERIVNKHAGRIWAKSEPGMGATFYFTVDTETGKPRKTAMRAARA
jgi:hypothetical protein